MKTYTLLFAILFIAGCPKKSTAQVPVTLGPAPIATFINSSGFPIANGLVCTYSAGTNTPQSTYTDSTGTVANPNGTPLNAAGRANLWFTSSAYKIVVRDAGGDGTCGAGGGTIEFTTDNFQVNPFLAGNNSWTGNQTFAGTSTFNGAVTFTAGGSISGTFSGSPTFSGNPTFSGTPTFSNAPTFSSGIKADSITGTITTGGSLTITGANGTLANPGEALTETAGGGGPTGNRRSHQLFGWPWWGNFRRRRSGYVLFRQWRGWQWGRRSNDDFNGKRTGNGKWWCFGTARWHRRSDRRRGREHISYSGNQRCWWTEWERHFRESGPYSISGGWNKCRPDLFDNRQCRRGNMHPGELFD